MKVGVWIEAECCFSWVGGEPDDVGVCFLEGEGADPLNGGAVAAVEIYCASEHVVMVITGECRQAEGTELASHEDFSRYSNENEAAIGEHSQIHGSLLVVLGQVVLSGARVDVGGFLPSPGVGDVGVGPGDDERQDSEGRDDSADACGSDAHGSCSLVVMVGVSGLVVRSRRR